MPRRGDDRRDEMEETPENGCHDLQAPPDPSPPGLPRSLRLVTVAVVVSLHRGHLLPIGGQFENSHLL
jgi:hypothetical protein